MAVVHPANEEVGVERNAKNAAAGVDNAVHREGRPPHHHTFPVVVVIGEAAVADHADVAVEPVVDWTLTA